MAVERMYVNLGRRIRSGRNRAGITQARFAKRMDISRPALANIEVGRQRITLHHVKQFAKVLRTTPAMLMRGIW